MLSLRPRTRHGSTLYMCETNPGGNFMPLALSQVEFDYAFDYFWAVGPTPLVVTDPPLLVISLLSLTIPCRVSGS